MKTFYYFSKNRLKFVEVKNFQQKFFFVLVFTSIIISFFLIGSYYIFDEIINADYKISSLKSSNNELKEKLAEYNSKFASLKNQIDEIGKKNNEFRLLTNLTPIQDDDYGIGGNVFKNTNYSTSNELRKLLDNMDQAIDNITVKVNVEKSSFDEAKTAFENNQKLYDALPAIIPAEGNIGDEFGMRFHPILKVKRMHNGIDIVNGFGTKIYASGKGVVSFVGWRTGLGHTVEIDHGFGYVTIYGHLSGAAVKEKQTVERGELIAYMGSSGELTTGPHLHYEVWHDGIALDPRNFIFEDLKFFQNANKN
jgi:murein DD-endopeptidase MepM/ murein hydrolase activator NlpD